MRTQPADTGVAQRLTDGFSRHQRYHEAIDEIALAQAELIQRTLELAARQLPHTVTLRAFQVLSEESGLPAAALEDLRPDHGFWCTDVLAEVARLAHDHDGGSAFGYLAELAEAASRSCRPRGRECSISGMTAALLTAAGRLRRVAEMVGKRRAGMR